MKINRGLKMQGDLKDRGKIKWTAMMLPEHVAQLREWQQEHDLVKKPELDAFDYDTMQEEIERALISRMETRLTSWKSGKIHYHRGIIKEANNQCLRYEDPYGIHQLPLDELVGVFVLT
ncbi:hypothetical protein HMPREF1210_03361 [Paenisporosarcina sp. HGH0030]|uniref:YolD-like family protein n=1 Tax=Paenisporosarcina sp. HGH0030 TaxID=1078085 RepID=UPI00034E909A|nr:YolD-like family protein [Paenisporosarcina sp. HGH0030]EPD49462.1 hypothetical protein HMPREF1210_03361 [Paenisporosarcina sp. HGH0030]